jgi:chemotaxis protein CheX
MDPTSNTDQQRVQLHLSVRAASPSLLAAAKASGETRSTNRDGWREELEKATCEVFEIMLGTSLGNAIEGSPRINADLTAMVGLAGSLCGVVGLRASSESARRMAAKMLGLEDIGVGDNVLDAFGEVCNMVAGGFKARIASLADGCALSVPTVISGRDYALHSLANGERFEVVFPFEGNALSVTLDMQG